jgi:hypothetical protein
MCQKHGGANKSNYSKRVLCCRKTCVFCFPSSESKRKKSKLSVLCASAVNSSIQTKTLLGSQFKLLFFWEVVDSWPFTMISIFAKAMPEWRFENLISLLLVLAISYADVAENNNEVEGGKPPRYNVGLRYFVAGGFCIYSKKWCMRSQVHGSTFSAASDRRSGQFDRKRDSSVAESDTSLS